MSFVQFVTELGVVVAGLVIVLDPFGLIPVMVGLTSHIGAKAARRMVVKVVASATLLLLVFTATGTWVLNLFGVTLNDLRMGGGILLLIIALKMVIEGTIASDGDKGEDAAIIPLISPLLIGPGAITASVVLAAIHGVLLTLLAACLAMLVCLLILLSARMVCRLIGDSGAALLTRVMGVFIATIAISYIRTGVTETISLYKGP